MFGFQQNAFQNGAFQMESLTVQNRGGGGYLRKVYQELEDKYKNEALAIFLLDG